MQIERGSFTNDSEYIRDLIRRDQENAQERAKFLVLKDAIQEGLSSGLSDRTVPQIVDAVKPV